MFTKSLLSLLFVNLLLFLIACGKNDDTKKEFQVNTASDFALLDIFSGHGPLEDAWNCLDGKEIDTHLRDTVNTHTDEFITFSYCFNDLLEDEHQVLPEMFGTDLKNITEWLINPDVRYQKSNNMNATYNKSGHVYADDFYSFLNALTEKDPNISKGNAVIPVNKFLTRLIEASTPQDINEGIQDLIEDIESPDFQDDFIDGSKILGKLLLQSDKPMWADKYAKIAYTDSIDVEQHENLDLGNKVEGIQQFTIWLNQMMRNPETREALHDIIKDLANTFDPNQTGNSNSQSNAKLKHLICQLEDHFTKGGEVYDHDPFYYTNTDETFIDAELGETIRDFFPFLIQLFMRSDRPNSLISDKNGDKIYPFSRMMAGLKAINWDPNESNIENSLYNMLQHDSFGRDRVTDPEAYHISHLEHLMALATIAANSGWKDGGITGEITDKTHPNYNHGHGDFWGRITLNDIMYAIKTSKILNLLGMYELSFQKDDKDHIYRSNKPFNVANKDDYKLNFDQNVFIGNFFAGNTGPVGSPTGGMNPKNQNGEPVLNAYKPYCPIGFQEDNIATVIISATWLSCWEGVGPYYYAPENPPTVSMYGKTWNIYYNPSGKVYAYVHKPDNNPSNWEYIYPPNPDGNDTLDDHVSYVGKLRKDKTHALFISDVDLTNGIRICNYTQELRIQIGDQDAPEIDTVATFSHDWVPGQCNTYYQEDVVDIINQAAGERICYPYDVGNKKYVQIKSAYGPIRLLNKSHIPIDQFLTKGAKSDESVLVKHNAIQIEGDASVSIGIDDESEKTITFSDPHLSIWSMDKIKNTLLESDIADNVHSYRYGFIINGSSNDPEIARLSITNLPGSITNGVECFFGGNGESIIRHLERWVRYRTTYTTDYYITRLNILGNNYYSAMDYDRNGNITCVDIEDGKAKAFVVEELMDETDERRACSSQEEAIFRNYQWFYADRKFILPVPLRVSLFGMDVGMIYINMESNGFAGFMNARKYRGNHIWAKNASDGESSIPGDFRFELTSVTILDYIAEENLSNWFGIQVQDLLQKLVPSVIYDEVMDCGAAFTAIMATNCTALYRLALPVAPKMHHGFNSKGEEVIDYLVSANEFQVGDEIWQNRNTLIPPLKSLLAVLNDYTEIDYEGKKSGIRQAIDSLVMLQKPLFYYQKDKGEFPHNNYKLRLVDNHNTLKSSADFYSDSKPMETWYGSDDERRYYLPEMKNTLVSLLIDSDLTNPEKRCDGILPEIKNTKILTNLLNIFMDDANNSVEFSRAIEQISSSIKLTKSEFTKINEGTLSGESRYHDYGNYKEIKFPDWMFATGEKKHGVYDKYIYFKDVRDEDFILDIALDQLIGHDEIDAEFPGYGLAEYPDDKNHEEDWEDFDDAINEYALFFHEDSKYSITQDLLTLLDAMLAKERPYSPEEITGLQYTLGKLFAYYNTGNNTWVYQGEEGFDAGYNIFKLRFPKIHAILKNNDQNYHSVLMILASLLNKDGLMEYLVDTTIETECVSAGWEEVFYDLNDFLSGDKIDTDSDLWSTLANLLDDVGTSVEASQDGAILDGLYEKYGFQVN